MSVTEDPAVGLCARCRHARQVATPRSLFWLCERSRDDAKYPRYPRLPMLSCPGFEPIEPVGDPTSGNAPREK